MAFDANTNDPFFSYEQDLEPADENRNRKIAELKQAIETGQYDVDDQWDRLIDNLKAKMTNNEDGADDGQDDNESV